MKRAVSLALLFLPALLHAQGNENVQDVVARTEAALNDLDYGKAATMARTLVELSDARRDPAIEVKGLQLLAAALYPEERAMQRPDSTRMLLKRLIWATPSAIIPRSISWPGLDSLLEDTRRSTLAIWATPESLYALSGTTGRVPILVRGSRPVAFSAVAQSLDGGSPIFLDSIPTATGGRLSFTLFDGDRQRVTSGRYELRLIATDTVGGESVARRYEIEVDAPSLALEPTPAPLSSDALLPERTVRNSKRNILYGVGLGAVTGLLASTMKGDEGVGPASKDNRAWVVGGAMSLGAILGAVVDKGRALPDNILRNQQARADREQQARLAEQENARLRGSYQATVRIVKELR